MLALAFDYRVGNLTALSANTMEGGQPKHSKTLFFIPGLDINLVYSSGMISLIKSKLSPHISRDVICFSKRFTLGELYEQRVVDSLVSTTSAPVFMNTVVKFVEDELLLQKLHGNSRFSTADYRNTFQRIKLKTYRETYELLMAEEVEDMGFDRGRWGKHGKLDLRKRVKQNEKGPMKEHPPTLLKSDL